MQNESWHCPAEIDMEFLGKVIILMAAYLSQNSNISLMVSHICEGTPITSQRLVFALFVGNSLDGISHLWHVESNVYVMSDVFPQNKLNCRLFRLVWPENTFPPSFGPSQMTLGPDNSAAFTIIKIQFRLIQLQVAFLDAAADCVKWQWFYEVLLRPCGYVHHGSMPVFLKQYQPEGSMVTHIQQWFPPLAFTHRDFPWLSSWYYELWMVKDLNSLRSCIQKHCLWMEWQLSHKVWHKAENYDPSLLAKTKPLVDAPFILNLDNLTS